MTQPPLFSDLFREPLTAQAAARASDARSGEQLKRQGIRLAADNKSSLLAHARKLAIEIALKNPERTCTADEVQGALEANGISPHALGNSAGALFRDGGWTWTGKTVKSTRAHAHCNMLRVWRYVGA